jgi:hypothetical protein
LGASNTDCVATCFSTAPTSLELYAIVPRSHCSLTTGKSAAQLHCIPAFETHFSYVSELDASRVILSILGDALYVVPRHTRVRS